MEWNMSSNEKNEAISNLELSSMRTAGLVLGPGFPASNSLPSDHDEKDERI
jgi:hypothetical protein